MLETEIRLAGIEEESIVDGPGLRYVIFTQGCQHNCKGCQNPETHDFNGGTIMNIDSILNAYQENPLLAGMTFSGGEPFAQAAPLVKLAKAVHALGGDIVTYTGYTYEELLAQAIANPNIQALLEETDLLVDGPFIEELKSLELTFCGSKNQRVLTKADREEIKTALNQKLS